MAEDEVRPVGRPREVENPVRVSVRISASEYDRLDRQSRRTGLSVPALIRLSVLKIRQLG